jgi:hypothetical protein
MNNLDVCNSCGKRIEKLKGVGFGSITFNGQSIETDPARFCTIDCTIEWLVKLDEIQPKDGVNQILA